MPKPPIVIECPVCGEKYLISRNGNLPSENATRYSDGYFTDLDNWRTPNIIGCVTCDLGFYLADGKIVADTDWDNFNTNWSHLKKAEPPTAGALVLDLRSRKNVLPQHELILRKEFWYASVHTETGRLLMKKNEKFNAFFFSSLLKLEQLIEPSYENGTVLKAEINRQLGNFDTCLNLLANIEGKLSKEIAEKAQKGISEVFEL